MTLTKLHGLTPLDTEIEPGITEAQHEALALAYERGYFDTPER